jgi:hypothetical protein
MTRAAVSREIAHEAEFDLAVAMAELYATSRIADPEEFAEALLPRIPLSGLQEIVRDVLPCHIRIWFGRMRREPTGDDPQPGRSAKGQFVRSMKLNAVASILASRYHVGDGNWKVLGDCGEEELAFMAAERKQDAERTLARAARFEKLRKSLRKHRVALVRELPEEAVLAFDETSK